MPGLLQSPLLTEWQGYKAECTRDSLWLIDIKPPSFLPSIVWAYSLYLLVSCVPLYKVSFLPWGESPEFYTWPPVSSQNLVWLSGDCWTAERVSHSISRLLWIFQPKDIGPDLMCYFNNVSTTFILYGKFFIILFGAMWNQNHYI